MIINIRATNMELTPAIRDYAEKKISCLIKFFDNITQADIDVGKTSNHHLKGDIYYAEVNLHVPGKMERVRKEEQDLYKAIDKVKDHFKVVLDRMRDKMRRLDRKVIRNSKMYDG